MKKDGSDRKLEVFRLLHQLESKEKKWATLSSFLFSISFAFTNNKFEWSEYEKNELWLFLKNSTAKKNWRKNI